MLEIVEIRITRVPIRQELKQKLALWEGQRIKHDMSKAIVDEISQRHRAGLAKQLQALGKVRCPNRAQRHNQDLQVTWSAVEE